MWSIKIFSSNFQNYKPRYLVGVLGGLLFAIFLSVISQWSIIVSFLHIDGMNIFSSGLWLSVIGTVFDVSALGGGINTISVVLFGIWSSLFFAYRNCVAQNARLLGGGAVGGVFAILGSGCASCGVFVLGGLVPALGGSVSGFSSSDVVYFSLFGPVLILISIIVLIRSLGLFRAGVC